MLPLLSYYSPFAIWSTHTHTQITSHIIFTDMAQQNMEKCVSKFPTQKHSFHIVQMMVDERRGRVSSPIIKNIEN
jgi:hypothetical protein